MSLRKLTRNFIPTVVAAFITLVFMLPLLWLVISAFRPEEDIFRYLSPFESQAIIPSRVTLDNFVALFATGFGRQIFNSIFVALAAVAIGLFLNSLAAFALSAIEFRGRGVVFSAVVLSFLIPFESIAIPLSDGVRALGLGDTYFALIAPGVANGFAIFLLRQFFLEVPKDLAEAARMDGASLWRIYWSIYLPLSKAPMIGAGLMIFLFQWSAYLWPLLVTNSPSMKLAPIALAQFLGGRRFVNSKMFAGGHVLAIIPILVIVPLQRYFTRSVAMTGVK